MATLHLFDGLPTRDQIIAKQLTPAQAHDLDRQAARAKQIARLTNPDHRPQTFDLDNLKLLQAARKRLYLMALVAPPEIEQYISLAVLNLASAICEAARPYQDIDLDPLPTITEPPPLPGLTTSHLKHLREKLEWLELLVKTAPLEVALYLLRVTDWISITLIASEKKARQVEQTLAEEARNRTELHS